MKRLNIITVIVAIISILLLITVQICRYIPGAKDVFADKSYKGKLLIGQPIGRGELSLKITPTKGSDRVRVLVNGIYTTGFKDGYATITVHNLSVVEIDPSGQGGFKVEPINISEGLHLDLIASSTEFSKRTILLRVLID